MASNIPEFSVSDLAGALRQTIEQAYGFVRVRGEVSKVFIARSGHAYITLKDDQAILEGICWRTRFGQLKTKPEEGLEVVCSGKLTTYAGRSQYQLVIEEVALHGIGALLQQLELRKQKLAAEGLFAAERKRPLPMLPDLIGVVTSPDGAVIRDILHRLQDRFPRDVLVWPVAVQGEQSPVEVAAAIAGFNALPQDGWPRRPDVLIVARGGGSLEDLWGFNDEAVVRAVAASTIPVISAVGHETDTTLIDLVADRRAPTPTGAAEMAVPVAAELRSDLAQLRRRADGAVVRVIDRAARDVGALGRALPAADDLVGRLSLRLDEFSERLPRSMLRRTDAEARQLAQIGLRLRTPSELVRARGQELSGQTRLLESRFRDALIARSSQVALAAARLRPETLKERLMRQRRELSALTGLFERAGARQQGDHRARLAQASGRLETVSYQRTLARGYVLVRKPNGETVTRVESARTAGALELEFHDGRVKVQARGMTGRAARGTKGETKVRHKPEQGKLL